LFEILGSGLFAHSIAHQYTVCIIKFSANHTFRHGWSKWNKSKSYWRVDWWF